ncbi:MAG TPA: alpha/beta hydrolase [Acidimicrobiia bacterium]|nr:alpha/beta hydrolase [Acidimicrobiia bacterium]
MTLREPPKKPQASRLIGRFVGLIVLLALFALVVWTAATHQQAGAIERSNPEVYAPGRFVTVQNVVVHVTTFGSGEPDTVFVHDDTTGGGAALAALAEATAAESQGAVLVPDLVSFGFSSRPREPGRRLATSGQAETLAAMLDQLGVVDSAVVGFGWGGEVATELAVIRPDIVSRLVLVDTDALPIEDTGEDRLESLPFGVGEAFAYTLSGASPGAEREFIDECPSWAECEEVAELYRRAAEIPGTARGIWARQASDPAMVALTRLDDLAVPVSVVAVDIDEEAARQVADMFPHAEVVSLDADELPGHLAS